MLEQLRATIEQKPAVGYGLAAGVVLLAVAFYTMSGEEQRPVRDTGRLWYWDLNTNEPFDLTDTQAQGGVGQAAPSGPLKADAPPLKAGQIAGVRLFRFACESCQNEQFNSYLILIVPPDLRQAMLPSFPNLHAPEELVFIRSLEPGPWHLKRSPEGDKLTAIPFQRCAGKKIVQCEYNER